MKKTFLHIISALSLMVNVNIVRGEVVDRIVLVVNDEVVTDAEIDRILSPIYEKYKTVYDGDQLIEKLEEARRKIIEQLVNDKLILSEAKKLNIEVDEKEIDQKVEDSRRRVGSQEKFEALLADQRLTMKELRMRHKEQIMSRMLIDQKLGSKITITPMEIKAFYDRHISEFAQPEEIKLRNILITPKDDLDVENAANLAKTILKKLREGSSFEELAKTYSKGPNAAEGGVMGYVKRGDLLPKIEGIVFELKEGDISDVIQTSMGFHIFKVDQKLDKRSADISEVRRDIENAIFNEKIIEKIKGWVEDLKKSAYIEFK